MYCYRCNHYKTYNLAGYLGESALWLYRGLDLKKLFVLGCIIFYDRSHREESKEGRDYLYDIIIYYSIISLGIHVIHYILTYKDAYSNGLDPSNANHGGIKSPIGDPIGYSHLKRYDYFTEQIGQHLKIPPLYKYEHLNYPNPKSQIILGVCLDVYREILKDGAIFNYYTSTLDREVLGINTIGPDPALDGLLLDNINVSQPGNHPYWHHHFNYFQYLKVIISYNGLGCNFNNPVDIRSKNIEIMNHLAWIKGRFDTLNNDPYESEKMDKGMEVIGLISVRWFFKNNGNITRNNVVSYSDIWEDFKNNNPNDILREHLEKYQADVLAARQTQAALVDNQGNDNDQVADNASQSNLNAIDDTY